MGRRKRRRSAYLGSCRETPAAPIPLPFTVSSLRALLEAGANADAPYTHQQIKNWAFRFWFAHMEGPLGDVLDPILGSAAKIAQDIDKQWDMYLANTHTLAELQTLDFSQSASRPSGLRRGCVS